jgi:O-antigen ligase
MSTIYARSVSLSLRDDAFPSVLSPVNLLFIASVFVAPWDLSLFGTGITLCDPLLVAVAFLVVIGRHRLQFLSFKFAAAIYVFLLFALLSTFRAIQPVDSFNQILQFVFIFFVEIPIILTLIRSQLMFRISLIGLLSGMMVGVIWAVVSGQVQGAGRTLTFYSANPNRLGYPTAYLLPFALYLLFETWRRNRMLALIIALPLFYLMLWALAASGSRSATVGTLVAAIVFLAFRHGSETNLRALLRLSLTLAVIGLVAYWFYQSDYFPTTLRQRVELTLMQKPSLTEDREDLAMAGGLAFLESPFIGVGLDNFRYVAGRYVFSTHQLPHNMWLNLLSAIGIFGTLAFLVLILNWFRVMVQAQRVVSDRSPRELLWAFIASWVAILTIYLFVPLPIQRIYWLIFGLGLALALHSHKDCGGQGYGR